MQNHGLTGEQMWLLNPEMHTVSLLIIFHSILKSEAIVG